MVKINSKAKPVPSLPLGWMVITTRRRRGATKGKQDKTYLSPTFERFRSLLAVRRYLAELQAALPAVEQGNVDDSADEDTDEDADDNAEDEEKNDVPVVEDNLLVQKHQDVVVVANIQAAASQEVLDNPHHHVVIVIDSSSDEDEDPDSLWI